MRIDASKKPFLGMLLALLLYFLLACLFVPPTAWVSNGTLHAKVGDATSTVWVLWVFEHYGNVQPFVDLVNYPYGVDFAAFPVTPVFPLVLVPLASLLGGVGAYNFFAFLGFFLSACAMFFLARHFLRDNRASFFSGLAFGFAPYAFMKSTGHLTLLHLEFVALFVLALFLFRERPSLLRGALLGLTLLLTAFFELYYLYFSLLFLVIFTVFFGARHVGPMLAKKRGAYRALFPYFKSGVVALLVFAALFALLVVPFLFGGASADAVLDGAQSRGLYGVVSLSAAPLSFVLPSVYHPLFGGAATAVIPASEPWRFAEQTLYVGLVVIALCVFALLGRRDRVNQFWLFAVVALLALVQGPLLRYVGVFGVPVAFFPVVLALWLYYHRRTRLALAFVALTVLLAFLPLFYPLLPAVQGAGAQVTGISQIASYPAERVVSYLERFEYLPVPMPTLVLHHFAPAFRAYARLSVFLMLALALLAGMGLKRLLDARRSERAKWLVAGLFCALLLFEFAAFPPERVTSIEPVPGEYAWLAGQPAGTAVAEYPLSLFPYYGLYQAHHGQPLLNRPDNDTGVGENAVLSDISAQATVDALRARGVRYVFVHADGGQLFSQAFPDQVHFQSHYARGEEAEAVSRLLEGDYYKKLSGITLFRTFGQTYVFELERLH